MMEIIKGANLLLRFVLELCALGALGYWGFKTGGELAAKIGLGIGAPVVAAVVWAIFVSPRAPVELPSLIVLLLQVLVFGSAVAGLAATGYRTLALVFGVIVVVNAVLMYVGSGRSSGQAPNSPRWFGAHLLPKRFEKGGEILGRNSPTPRQHQPVSSIERRA